MSSIHYIKDKLGLQDRGFVEVSDQVAVEMKRRHIPTFRGVLYEKDEFGNLLFVKENTVVLGGSINALEKLFGVFAEYRPSSLTTMYRSSLTFPSDLASTYNDSWERDHDHECHISLFGVGTGGCALDISAVYKPDFKQNTLNTDDSVEEGQTGNWIPLRVSPQKSLDSPGVLPGTDNAVERAKYHFRLPLSTETGTMYGWYLKEFESEPTIKSLWKNAPDLSKDGTEITSDSDLATGPDGVGIESFGEVVIHISADDVRDYFVSTGSTEVPRFNSLGLFSGVKREAVDGEYAEYYNVRLVSVVNFENVAKRLKTDSTYVYRIYSAL